MGKAFEKQVKTIEDQGQKQVEALNTFKSDDRKLTYHFRNFRTIRTFVRDINEGKITLEEANTDQDNLLRDIRNLNNKTRPQNYKKIQEKNVVLKNLYKFFEAREIVLHGFESKIFSIKSKGSGLLNTNQSKLKIITAKQMLQRLPIAFAHVKASNNWKFIKWNQADCLFFVSIKRNY